MFLPTLPASLAIFITVLFHHFSVCDGVNSGASFSGRKLPTVVYPPILYEMDYASYVIGSCCYSQA